MFLFNFYSNTNLFIVIYLVGLVVSISFFMLSIMFDSKRIYFLFLSSTISSILLNVNTIPVDIVIILFIFSVLYSSKLKGRIIKNKIFLNIMSFIIISILTVSGTFSVYNFIKTGSANEQTLFKRNIPLEKL